MYMTMYQYLHCVQIQILCPHLQIEVEVVHDDVHCLHSVVVCTLHCICIRTSQGILRSNKALCLIKFHIFINLSLFQSD